MMAGVSNLPTYVALQATYGNAPYKYVGVQDDGKLAYSFEKVLDQRVKFAVEYAGNGLVHIRSCYNNKYWVRLECGNWIAAESKDPVDDKTSRNCTLFKTNISADGKAVTFIHVQLAKTVGRRDLTPDRQMYLCFAPLATTLAVSTVVDYGSIVTLPQYVAFKDSDGYFITSGISEDCPLMCLDNNDIGMKGTMFETFTTPDGHIYISDYDSGLRRYWGSDFADIVSYFGDDDWKIQWDEDRWKVVVDNDFFEVLDDEICCSKYSYRSQDDGYPTDLDMLFSVIKLDHNVVALRQLKSNKFLEKRYCVAFGPSIQFRLTATSDAITKEARLQVVEPVIKRQVDVFQFHLDRARIYDRTPLILAQGGASNATDREQEYTLAFTFSKSTISTWNTTTSWHVDTKASFSSKIPFIGGLNIEIGGGYSQNYQWGESVTQSEQVTSSYTVKVPPRQKASVTAVATQAKCDVPFSYNQVDQMANGELKTTSMSNGFYTGVNSYQFDFVVHYDPL